MCNTIRRTNCARSSGARESERLAGGAGAARIEIGVFEYNERALSFCDQLGYVAFERRAERAYWDGRLWSEILLLKTL